MKIILKYLTDDQVKELRQIFLALDHHNTGYITVHDLKKALDDLAIESASSEIDEIVKRVDYLDQGKINYSAFLAATMNFKAQITD
jgi:Ca2+-binding EF-hand superfamily protein